MICSTFSGKWHDQRDPTSGFNDPFPILENLSLPIVCHFSMHDPANDPWRAVPSWHPSSPVTDTHERHESRAPVFHWWISPYSSWVLCIGGWNLPVERLPTGRPHQRLPLLSYLVNKSIVISATRAGVSYKGNITTLNCILHLRICCSRRLIGAFAKSFFVQQESIARVFCKTSFSSFQQLLLYLFHLTF